LAGIARIGQQPVGAGESLSEHVLGKRHALAFEQPLNPPWLDPMPCRNCRHRQVGSVQLGSDIFLDETQPRRSHPSTPGDLGSIPSCTDGERHEVMDMRYNLPSQVRRDKSFSVFEDADVLDQKPQRCIVGGNRPTIRSVQAGNER